MSLKLICRVRSSKVKRGEDLKVNVFAADVSKESIYSKHIIRSIKFGGIIKISNICKIY